MMQRIETVWVAAAVVLLVASSPQEAGPRYFPGGRSDISSRDPNRGQLAIRKWTNPGAWSEEDPAASPYFWDFDAVGRPVFLRVMKNGNRNGSLEVWLENPENGDFEHFKTYRVAYFSGTLGPKMEQGDLQAPEGFYFISRGRMNPNSSFHLSMDMGYPNAYDQYHGRTGNFLMIHGNSVSTGCFAMTDASIEQIYTLVDAALKNGQPFVRVHSFPFAMTDETMAEKAENDHIEFWRNLKEGWDWFSRTKRPPNVEVAGGKYAFSESSSQ